MLPFLQSHEPSFQKGDWVFIPNVRQAVSEKWETIPAYAINRQGEIQPMELTLGSLTNDEREIILAGCLINYNRDHK